MDLEPRTNRPAVRATGAAVVAAIVLGTLAGPASCGKDEDTSADDRPRATTTTTLTPEAEVEAAYRAYWEMGARLLQAPDPDDPEISQRATGKALADMVAGLRQLEAANLRSELGPLYTHEVVHVGFEDPTHALVEDCAVDDSQLIDTRTGGVAEESVVTELLRAGLVRDESGWRVESMSRIEAWQGAVPCE